MTISNDDKILIIGGGAIGFSLAVHLKHSGKKVAVVRVSTKLEEATTQKVSVVDLNNKTLVQEIDCYSLESIEKIQGTVVVATKANANIQIADVLEKNAHEINLVIMQNGIGVENPFLEKEFHSIFRCVVYITAEKTGPESFSARMIKPSPIGIISDKKEPKERLATILSTNGLSFYEEDNIEKEVWKKGIVNAVFNSICPLIEVDNGIFARDNNILELARKIVMECVPIAGEQGILLNTEEIIDQIIQISKRSTGQLISTLQDIRKNRETEINFLNLEICRIAKTLTPPISLPITEALGELILKKSEQRVNDEMK